MGSVLFQTLLMFFLSFAISMFVALLIYLIRKLLTSLAFNSLFDEESKKEWRRLKNLKKERKIELQKILHIIETQNKIDLFDYYEGVDRNRKDQEDDYR